MNIFLDLSKYISHFSSSTVVCALRGITKGPLLEGCGFDRDTTLATRSGWKWMTALSVRTVRRLSTVRGRHGLVDFEKSIIIWKLREVERSERSAAWCECDPLLCSQGAKGVAPASGAGLWWFKRRAIDARCQEARAFM